MKKSSAFIIAGVLVLFIIVIILLLVNKSYTVTFDSNGGSLVKAVEVKKRDKVDKPSDPTRDGYQFGGWYLDDELFDFDTKITKNITLVAKWVKAGFTVTFDSNGGNSLDSVTITDGTIKNLPTPSKDGYKFLGWYLDGKKIEDGSKITGNVKLVAKWLKIDSKAKEYTVSFDTDGGSELSDVKVLAGTTLNKPNDPQRSGYTFVGWYLNDSLYDFSTVVNSDIKLIAKWEVIKEDTGNETKKDVISYLQEDIETSIVGQTTLYVTKNGEKVNGYLDITTIDGDTYTKEISKDGYITNKNQIKTISNARLEK